MTTPSKNADFETPQDLLTRLLGPVGARLFDKEIILVFDAASGFLASATAAALGALGLDLDAPFQPTYAESVGPEAAERWPWWRSSLPWGRAGSG